MHAETAKDGHASSLRKLLEPRSVAVIGASDVSRVGRGAVANLVRLGYEGSIYPVNPKYKSVLGISCYASIGDVPETVDAALLLTSAEKVVPLLEDCGQSGVGAAVVPADGLSGRGLTGQGFEGQLRAVAERFTMAICGPNSMGILNLATGGSLYIGLLDRHMEAGDISLILQSGYLGLTLANSLSGSRFRYVISSGNEAVVDTGDYVRYLAQDAGTRVIGLVLEGVRNPDRLLEGIRAAKGAGKSVVLLKLGTSVAGKRVAASHTGALAGASAVASGVCRQFGIGQVSDLEQMLMACAMLSDHDPPPGNRLGVLTLSGGYGALIADLAEQVDLELPAWAETTRRTLEHLQPGVPVANPYDAWASGDYENTMRTAVGPALRDPETDILVVVQDLPGETSPHRSDVPVSLVPILAEEAAGAAKPTFVLGTMSVRPPATLIDPLRDAGISYLAGATASMGAISAWLTAGRSSVSPDAPSPTDASARIDRDMLRASGVPMVPQRLAITSSEAQQAADGLGYPVVLKVESDDILHKSDVGGVALDVRSGQVAEEFQRLLDTVASAVPEARVHGVTVEKQYPPGLEVIVGATIDADWGWVVTCGLGGIYTEVLQDVSFRRAPITQSEALKMLTELKAYPVLEGTRGRPRHDVEALTSLISTFSSLVAMRPQELVQIDLNPIIVYEEGAGLVVVDALFVPAPAIHDPEGSDAHMD